jgi:hypothetical protein
MRILVWHVHGSWMTSFVAGHHDYVIPLTPDRDADGRGRAQTWDWPARAREVPVAELREEPFDVVVLQRPHEAELVEQWTGRRVGLDVPAVYLEHNTPTGTAVGTEHAVTSESRLSGIPVVHVTHFNAMAWDCGDHDLFLVEHGIADPGHRYTGEDASLAAVVNEPVRRWRVAGTDLLLDLARSVPVHVYGMATDQLVDVGRARGLDLGGRTHDLPQAGLHATLGRHRAYFHPYRWTSLGLAMLEAMALGMPVLALSTTEAPEAVPPEAGVVSCDLSRLRDVAQQWLDDPATARQHGEAARAHVLTRYSLDRFLDSWDRVLKEVTS